MNETHREAQGKTDRFFVGISLSEPFQSTLWQLKLRLFEHERAHKSVKYPLVPHITLLSPSEVRGLRSEEAAQMVQHIAAPFLPLHVTLSTVQLFNEHTCSISVPGDALAHLRAALLRYVASPPSSRATDWPFSPHITLLQLTPPDRVDQRQLFDIVTATIPLPLTLEIATVSVFKQTAPRVYEEQALR